MYVTFKHGLRGPRRVVAARCLRVSVLAVAGAVALSACSGSGSDAASGDEIVVGLNLELTGAGSFLGEGMEAGIKAAADQLNANGGVGGKQISIVSRDNESDPSKAVTVVSELGRAGAQAIVGPGFAQDCAAAAPTLIRENLVGLCISAGNLPEDDANMFGIGIDYTTMENAIAAQYAQDGVKRVGLVASRDTSGDQTVDKFVKAAEPLGITVDIERFNSPATDLTPQLLAVSRNNPDAIRIQATGPDALVGVANVKSLGITTPTWLPNSSASLYFASQVKGEVAAGNILTWIPAMLAPNGTVDHPNQAPEIEGLQQALPEADTISAAGWDAMKVLAAAIEKAGGTGTDDLVAALEGSEKYYGAYSVQQITADDHRGASDEGTLIPAAFTVDGTFVPWTAAPRSTS